MLTSHLQSALDSIHLSLGTFLEWGWQLGDQKALRLCAEKSGCMASEGCKSGVPRSQPPQSRGPGYEGLSNL